MADDLFLNADEQYSGFIRNIKQRVHSAQIKAALSVNSELIRLYWDIAEKIIEIQTKSTWGDGFLKKMSKDLSSEFPDMKGFSRRNLELMRQWYRFWMSKSEIAKQLVAQIPWGHNLVIVTKSANQDEALFYIQKTIEHNWSRAVLTHQMEGQLYHRSGKAITNFEKSLPAYQSDLANQIIKDPYIFDFLTIQENYDERELEKSLLDQLTKFLLELGAGFAFLGRQYKLVVDDEDFYMDLLFYHVHLHSYVIVELKRGKFKPEYAGKLNFYISVVDDQIRRDNDNPSIGLLICKSKNKTIVEYALKDMQKPIGVSEYHLTRSLPDEYQSALPSIEAIEAELGKDA